jgi:hypothetical protein
MARPESMTTATLLSPEDFVPEELLQLDNPQTAIPTIAKNIRLIALIDEAVRGYPKTGRRVGQVRADPPE